MPMHDMWREISKMGRTFQSFLIRTGRIKYPAENNLGRILFKMGRTLSDIRPLFEALNWLNWRKLGKDP